MNLSADLRRRFAQPARGRAERLLGWINRTLARADVAVVRASSGNAGVGAPPHLGAARVDSAAPGDLNMHLHALRTERLALMPTGAKTVLSAGCSGRWYFEWLEGAYAGIERHIGLEAFLPRPPDLPANVQWLDRTVSDMEGVEDGTVDLVFSGQNIEHLWPGDVIGFLRESKRVLRRGGWLVLDSPNRSITEALNYLQPEHVDEFTPEEIERLLHAAGFADISISGVWLCFDRDQQLLLPLAPNRVLRGWTADRRSTLAADRPEDSFIWWAQARNTADPVDEEELATLLETVHARAYGHRLEGFLSECGRISGRGRHRTVSVDRGTTGVLVRGPRAPVEPGSRCATFHVRTGPTVDADAVIATLEVRAAQGTVASRPVVAGEAGTKTFASISVPFTLQQTAFDVEFVALSTGAAALSVRLHVDLTS